MAGDSRVVVRESCLLHRIKELPEGNLDHLIWIAGSSYQFNMSVLKSLGFSLEPGTAFRCSLEVREFSSQRRKRPRRSRPREPRRWRCIEERVSGGAVLEAFGPVRFMDPAFVPRSASAHAWTWLFHAEFIDPETGLYNYGYRSYHPQLGRWISRDPIGEAGGMNLYAFAGNDGINRVDFYGMSPFEPARPVFDEMDSGCHLVSNPHVENQIREARRQRDLERRNIEICCNEATGEEVEYDARSKCCEGGRVVDKVRWHELRFGSWEECVRYYMSPVRDNYCLRLVDGLGLGAACAIPFASLSSKASTLSTVGVGGVGYASEWWGPASAGAYLAATGLCDERVCPGMED